MSKTPAISVVLPVYNGEAFLREAVESILEQTFTDFELIIINDGSTDGSGPLSRELATLDRRIVLVERPNDGLVSALNEGISRARSNLIARMDADDVAMPERLELQYARMQAEPQLGVLGSFTRLMDKTGSIIRLSDYPVTELEAARFLERGCPIAHPTAMMRREVVLAAGGYRKAFSHCEDYDLWLRVNELGYGIANLPKPLLNYRMHGGNVSAVHREAQELGTLIARLAHRVRKAGLRDPTEGVDRIYSGLIDVIPIHLRQDVEATTFVVRNAYISLSGEDALETAWLQYRSLDPKARRESLMCDFLMRLLSGAVRNRAYSLSLRVLLEALRLHPRPCCRLLCGKFNATVQRLYSGL
ncbi:glycosyltransferase [Rhizobium sp. F40D2]|uniref:glycosyltransferase n=1 Tax=Rhizobium sp. F40D2 TaxID=3453141 RepID=UPI003F25CB13